MYEAHFCLARRGQQKCQTESEIRKALINGVHHSPVRQEKNMGASFFEIGRTPKLKQKDHLQYRPPKTFLPW